MPLDELDAITEYFTGSNMSREYAQKYRRHTLRRLRRLYAPPAFEKTAPERVTLNPEDLPTLSGYTLADPARGVPRPYFFDSEGQPHTFPLACDSLTVNLPDGDALLILTGLHGERNSTRCRVWPAPSGLWPRCCPIYSPCLPVKVKASDPPA